MPFVGAIPQPVRAQLLQMSPAWKGHDIAVACSGNFTSERALASLGFHGFKSNDISLYSCAVGFHLLGQEWDLKVIDDRIPWAQEYVDRGGVERVAVLMLLLDNLGFARELTVYHTRMWNAFVRRFDDLFNRTVPKVEKALSTVKLKEFYAGDCVDFVAKLPKDDVVLAFPPTYAKGYERLYKKLDEAFDWDRPEYTIFDEDRFDYFTQLLLKREEFYVLRDHPIEQLEDWKVGVFQMGQRSRPVHVYCRTRDPRIVTPHTITERINVPPVHDELTPPIHLKQISAGQFNTLRSKYLGKNIVPADPSWRLAIVDDAGRFIGALGFVKGYFLGGFCEVYCLSDFSVTSEFKRLSKLVVAVVLTDEVRIFLEQQMGTRVRTIGTTAFTDKPVSMKYRGLLDIHSRKEGLLNYIGIAGKWSMEDAWTWWFDKYGNMKQEVVAKEYKHKAPAEDQRIRL